MNYDALFVNPAGRTPRGQFVPAMLTLLAVFLFFAFMVKGRTAQFCMIVLLYPAFVLHARRLHDMGRSAWPVAVPLALMLLAYAIKLKYVDLGAQANAMLPGLAFAVAALQALWGCVGKGQSEPNRFGAPIAA